MLYADVILPLPLEGLFTYAIPQELQSTELVGCRAVVPLGRTKSYTALIVRTHDDEPSFRVRTLTSVLDSRPIVLPEQYELWKWLADYYMAPIGEVYKAALPAGLKAEEGYRPRTETFIRLAENFRTDEGLQVARNILARAPRQLYAFNTFLALNKGREVTREELINAAHSTLPTVKALTTRGLLTLYTREVGRLADSDLSHTEEIKPLSQAQQNAYDDIQRQFAEKSTVLLHGVTSSGKTEIYIHLIEETLQQGGQVLYLLPEIALTYQIMQRLRAVFGNHLGIYHSRYSDAQRVELWQKQMSNSPCQVILGARSAVFLPFQRLSLVIIDEEHETSFKQQEPTPRYHARSVALMMARRAGAKTLLGTATPSIESFYNAQTGKYGLTTLSTRYKGIELPHVEVVDTRDLQRRKIMKGYFSPQLTSAIQQALSDGKQAILFHNRRGYALQVECRDCGWVPRCPNCDVSLTLHRTASLLSCHYCGHTVPIPVQCPECHGTNLTRIGAGTEKIEDEIIRLFPTARVARMDLDSTRTHNAHDRLLGDFAMGRTNVLVGTQMVTKGLDFDNVAVVGIVDADALLAKPDFRAYEQAFQMMSQVSGRAGRKGARGQVFLQTRHPDLPLIRQVVTNDYTAFYSSTLKERLSFHYPPFSHIVRIHLRHSKNNIVEEASLRLASLLRNTFRQRVLGPDRPSVARVKQQNIRTILLKIESRISLSSARPYIRQACTTLTKDSRFASVTVFCDVDPL